ncbi:MAG: DUF4838 domain-containing protein [Armatimonadia bacterium]|nr:DUF4838 domain-containing protein [Armatimonadia bacterium]
MLTIIASFVTLICACAAFADVPLVADGQAQATIVVGEAQPERALSAAADLNYHLERATGAVLPIVAEADVDALAQDEALVVIGGGALAESLVSLDPPLAEEEFAIRTAGRHVVFIGSDTVGEIDEDDPRSASTLWAVGYFLDREMGVRWLWPGDVGTYVPEAETVVVPEMDVRERPEMVTRTFRPILTSGKVRRMRETNFDEFERIEAESERWQDRHLMGRRERIGSMHAFDDWWEKYHEDYPEIFATLPEGMTHPYPTPERVNLCVSDPQVEQLILQEWREAGSPDMWSVAPNDGQGYCVCEDCRALDVPNTLDADPLDIVWNRSVVTLTGRYLDLWRRLLDRMRAENPDASLKTLAYANYRLANSQMGPLGYEDALTISLVPDNWGEEEYQSLSEWQRIGADVIMRPNFWFVGYAAPYMPLHEAGRFWQHAVDTGIVGWDSNMLGYWGSQGPYYYLVTRLCARPDLTVDEVLGEYTSAFGAAAPAVDDYLEYWEHVTEEADWPDWAGHFQTEDGWFEQQMEEYDLNEHPFWSSWSILPLLYTDERLAEARAILDRAEALADDEMALQRIEFLRDGLLHLQLSRDAVELANAELRPEVDGYEALREQERDFRRLVVRLKNLRAALNARHVVWADSITWHEDWRNVKMGRKFADAWGISAVPEDTWAQWRFRKDPEDIGVAEEWFAAEAVEPDAWQPTEIGVFWGDTEVGDYQGYGWYRTSFEMPAQWEHETVALSFGAVDEQAWIYLNGELVGEHTLQSESKDIEGFSIGDLWNVPFTIEVPVEEVKLGEANSLVVRVHNEVGAGGIWGGVYVQPPSDPLFVSTDELPDGVKWEPGVDYTDFRMTRIGSGRVDVTVDADTQGVIMEAGADGGGWALYVHDGMLYFQCGKGNEFRAQDQSVIEVPIEAGRHVIEWSADATRSKAIVRIDGEIAAISEQPIYNYIAGNDPGGIGGIHNVVCRNAGGWYSGEAGDFTGTIHSAMVWPDMVCF